VRAAGAVGDGVADDTAAILRAIASLPAAGGTVSFPPGRYLTLQQKIVINRSHVRLEGAPGAVIRGMPGAWESAVLVQVKGTPQDHLTDVTITGLEFDGNQAAHKLARATQAHLLDIENADRVAVRDNYFHDSPGDAIKISPRTTVCRLVSIQRNRIDTCLRNGISVVAGEDIDIVNNVVFNFNTVGIDVEPNDDLPCRFILIQGNTLRPAPVQLNLQNSNRLYGISLKSSSSEPGDQHSHVRVIGNLVRGISEGSVRYPVAGIFLQQFKAATIASNQIFEARQGIFSSEAPATNGSTGEITGNHVRGSVAVGIGVRSNLVVSGNTVEEGQDAGILLHGMYNVCTGNICRRNGQGASAAQPWGIWVNNGPNLVQGNRCFDDRETRTQQYGIYLKDGVNEACIEFNDVAGNREGGVRHPSRGQNCIRLNAGHVTESSGAGRIEPGKASIAISHGLAIAPRAQDIAITLTGRPASSPGALWVSDITAKAFTVNVERDPGGSGLDFAWAVNARQ
jgi:nitrous oxidase accessory protein NosD